VDYLSANSRKAREELGWRPVTSFDQMVTIMVEAELERQRTPLRFPA
jgi:GDPmannose 4,6-dehydratase